MGANFIPGLELSKKFYWEAVRPILASHYPDVPHSAALLGNGSEVLGFDTAMSMDHDWCPRVMIFLGEEDYQNIAEALESTIRNNLPSSFCGHNIKPQNETTRLQPVVILTARKLILDYLGFDIQSELEPADWLTFPEQELCAITRGAIHWDDIHLQEIRQRFAYYPKDVWLYLLAAGWNRIGQEEHLMSRAGYVGDEIGSALIAARLTRDVMRLCFLMEKQYAPYPKWFGTAFARLDCAKELMPILQETLTASKWEKRMECLASAYEKIVVKHNGLGITEPLDKKPTFFFDRPFLVIFGEEIAQVIAGQIVDPIVKQMAGKRLIGGVDQFSDSTDLLCDMRRRQIMKQFYR